MADEACTASSPKLRVGPPRAGRCHFSVNRATTADPSLDCRYQAESMHKHNDGQSKGIYRLCQRS